MPIVLPRPLLALALLLVSCGVFAAASNAPFLWEVKGPHATHYLLGSVHLLPEAADALPDGIADAYDAAAGLVFESDIGALNSTKSGLALLSAAKARRGLRAEVDTATYAKLRERMAKLSMPRPLCEQYKPWFCALTLEVFAYQKAGFTGEHGLDRQLYESGKADGKHISWFESPADHLQLFMNMDDGVGKQLLAAAVSEDTVKADEPAAIFRAWRDNDTGKIEALVGDMKAHYPLIYRRLLADRNQAWAARLKTLLDGAEPQMVIVGAAHWLGPDGLLVQLKAAGYKVRPFTAADSDLITATPHGPALIAAAAGAGTRAAAASAHH